jgi:hypothetical protein
LGHIIVFTQISLFVKILGSFDFNHIGPIILRDDGAIMVTVYESRRRPRPQSRLKLRQMRSNNRIPPRHRVGQASSSNAQPRPCTRRNTFARIPSRSNAVCYGSFSIVQDSQHDTISEILVSIGRAFKGAWGFHVSWASLCISSAQWLHRSLKDCASPSKQAGE